MSNEEAIEELRRKKQAQVDFFESKKRRDLIHETIMSYDMAINALEKQIVIEPDRSNNEEWHCKACNAAIHNKFSNYCWVCGQKIRELVK